MSFSHQIQILRNLTSLSNSTILIRYTSVTISAARIRKMSLTAAPTAKYDWLVILPDHEGVLAKRMEVRQSHLTAVKPLTDSGFWKLGGAMLEEVPKEGEGLKIFGSAMMAHAASKEEVLDVIKQDVYFESGVWDLNKIQIYPFKTAFRNP